MDQHRKRIASTVSEGGGWGEGREGAAYTSHALRITGCQGLSQGSDIMPFPTH